ncbi:MAG: hypothetical protein A2W00_06020 [Candidatus Eisenbacteria bacterium RBG_16_71_46]|nr:MAG: hypothetical protein A2W00_06020 [Candidatus Eisenbacteria bacterium RBG_16_71_46]OGF22484.1 MAG: hypothetical protein A2V63_11960 [Candidatus Eisenbacteria bacterium RBG_19FT_COMBO_70_11]
MLRALALAALLALAPADRARASWMEPPPPYRPKDFAILWYQGFYHIFYTRIDTSLPETATTRDLGHAVSSDLYYWEQLDPILTVDPARWDNAHVWAPSVVIENGVFHLYYTGVSSRAGSYSSRERIGLATSTDLLNWTRTSAPVFACDLVPWAYCDSLDAGTAFRDPFVMQDPGDPRRRLVYYSANPASDPGTMVVGVAESDGDWTAWSDLGPLWISHLASTGSNVAESPHLFDHNGLWYLFLTVNGSEPLAWATGPDPLGGPSSWTYRGRLSELLGYSTAAWFASEHVRNGSYDYLAFLNGQRIEIKRMMWRADGGFDLADPNGFRITGMGWSAPEVGHGDSVTLTIRSSWWMGRSAAIRLLRVIPDGTEEPLSMEAMGMASSIPLTGDTTFYRWRAVVPPGGGVISYADADLIVRLEDGTAETPKLRVDPPPPPPEAGWAQDPSEDGLILLRPRPRRAPGAPVEFLVELQLAGEVRLELFDLQGRRLRTLAERRMPAGATVIDWNGRDAAGRRARPGIYFARLRTQWGTRVARAVLEP